MRCQESSRKTPKCSCCNLCIQVQNAKSQKNNPTSERVSYQTTNDSYFKNFAIPDDLYDCKENINRVKSFNERVLKILDDLRQRRCRILDTEDCIGPSEDEDDEEEELEKQGQQQLHQRKKLSDLREHQSHLQQQKHSQHRSHSLQNQSCEQKEQQHSQHQSHSYSQHQSCQQKQPSHLQEQHSHQPHSLQNQSCEQKEQQHSQHQSHSYSQHQSCQQKQPSHLQEQHSHQPHSLQNQSCEQKEQQHSQHQSHSYSHQSCQQKQPSHLQQQHSHQPHSHQNQSCEQKEQQHSQHQSHSYSQKHQSCEQKQLSHLQQQEQLHHQELCEPNTDSKGKLQVIAPCGRMQNLGYIPQSNFLRKMKRRAEGNANTIGSPLMQCGCVNCVPDGIRYQTQIMCPCCRCNPVGFAVQSVPCGRLQMREGSAPYSDISSMHDPCTCFRTWRPNPCAGHFPEYQREIFERENGICASEAHIQRLLNDRYDGCEDKTPRKKKGKSGHVSRLDRRKRRTGRRKSKPDEKECLPSGTDFSPSLKRPHPNSCERCWRYASPSRSPVNRPSQRFDPNYRRSHSEVNINTESKGNLSKSGSRYSSANCVDFDPETKVHEVISSVDRYLTRTKSADNVKKSSLLRPASPKLHKRAPKLKDDAENSRTKKGELDLVSTQRSKGKYQNCISSGERRKEILRCDRQDPMPCSPSMFDKKSQRSNSKKSTSNRLSSSESCKENIKIKRRPSSACQIETSEDYFDKPRAQSFDRNYLKEGLCIPPERMRKCCCTKPRARTVNMNMMCDQPLFYQRERHCFPEVKDPFGVSNNQEDPMGFDKPCPWHFDIRPCMCSFMDLPRSKFRAEGLNHCCCQEIPVTLWNKIVVSKDGSEAGGKGNEEKIRNKSRRDGTINPRKYCVFYLNKSEENEKDGVEVLIEELTERRNGRDSKSHSIKNRTKKMHEPRSESMALKFQKGIDEKCRRRENNGVSYF